MRKPQTYADADNPMWINCIVMVRSYQAAASRQSAKWQKLRLFSRASGENYDLESKDDAEKEGYLFLNRRRCPTSLYLSITGLAHLQVVKIQLIVADFLIDFKPVFYPFPDLAFNFDHISVMKITSLQQFFHPACVSINTIIIINCNQNPTIIQPAPPFPLYSSSAMKACTGRIYRWSQRLFCHFLRQCQYALQ